MSIAFAIIVGSLWGCLVGVQLSLAVAACTLLTVIAMTTRVGLHAALGVGAACVGAVTGATPALLGPPPGEVAVAGTVAVTRCADAGGMRCSVTLDHVTIDGAATAGRVPLSGWREDYAVFGVGDRIAAMATLEGHRTQPNPGLGWPERQPWLRWRARSNDDVPQRLDTGTGWSRARAAVAKRLQGDPQIRAFYAAILLGERRGLDAGTQDAFVDTGTAHLLAISGLHLAVLAMVLFKGLTALFLGWPRMAQAGRPRVPAAVLTVTLIWFYAALVGAHSQATQRAAVFISVYLGALVLARQTSAGRSLWVAAAALSLADPRALLSPGFQLSFAAAGALVAAAPRLQWLDAWLSEPGRLPESYWLPPVRFLALVGATTLICQLATAPLAAAWFGQTSWAGLVVNLAAIPLTTMFVVPLGALWLVCATVSQAAGEAVAGLAEVPARVLLDLVQTWGEWLGPAQGAMWPHEAGAALAAAVALVLVWTPRARRAAAFLALFGWAALAWAGPSRDGLRMALLDVGHGDAVVVRTPGGATMLVDTGGTFSRKGDGDGANRWIADRHVVPALARLGANRVDIMVISHGHLDHVGAATRVAQRMRVGELWLSPCGRSRPAVKRLVAMVERRGGTVRTMDASAPVEQVGGIAVHTLWPDRESVLMAGDPKCVVGLNDGSLVLRLDYAGRRVLLTGDIEEGSESELVEARRSELRADVMKVPHHGSRTSSTPDFLDAVGPRWAVVTGELHAGSRPPHLSVLSRYFRRRVETWVTGSEGAVAVTVSPNGEVTVRTRGTGRLPP